MMHKILKNPLFCDFLEKPSLDFAETYLFLILEVCSLKRNHFHLVNYFLGSQPILAQCAVKTRTLIWKMNYVWCI